MRQDAERRYMAMLERACKILADQLMGVAITENHAQPTLQGQTSEFFTLYKITRTQQSEVLARHVILSFEIFRVIIQLKHKGNIGLGSASILDFVRKDKLAMIIMMSSSSQANEVGVGVGVILINLGQSA